MIEWKTIPESKRRRKPNRQPSPVDWGANKRNEDDFSYLVGAEDAFEHTLLLPGEQVAFCSVDKVAYHLHTWQFLRDQNNARCCICGRQGVIRLVHLPAATPEPVLTAISPSAQLLPAPETPAGTAPGEKVIQLAEIWRHVGLAVVVEGMVEEVYETRATGAFYIRFEKRHPTDPPFQGFKVVIRPRYVKEWTTAGVSPFAYQGKVIRVRGVIHDDPAWGIEILVNTPRLISILQADSDELNRSSS